MDRTPGWVDHAARMADATVRPESRWHRPLAATPRHLFVPRWWTASEQGGTWVYELREGARDPDAWMGTAYDNSLSVITRVGPHHADHAAPGTVVPETRPTSSATLPALVVRMYQHAVIADDSSILVTCGSGYGTALACQRLGDERVTSVDVDPYLIQAARDRLAAVGHHPRLEVCDVTDELPGTYDRIISTVSVPAIPPSWLQALQPGGRMVTTLSRTALIITADKTADGGATGKVAPEPAQFMTTRHSDDYPPPTDRNTDLWDTARKTEGESIITGHYPVMRVNSAWDVRTTLELTCPGIEHRMEKAADGTRTAYMVHPDGSWARATAPGARDLPTVHQGGPRRLWDELDRIRTWLLIDGDLPVAGAAVRIDPDGTCHLSRNGWSATVRA